MNCLKQKKLDGSELELIHKWADIPDVAYNKEGKLITVFRRVCRICGKTSFINPKLSRGKGWE